MQRSQEVCPLNSFAQPTESLLLHLQDETCLDFSKKKDWEDLFQEISPETSQIYKVQT
ncbi:MAG: hypothetical protein ACMUEL_03675 [Flavobacteriales bacterium Tduv]